MLSKEFKTKKFALLIFILSAIGLQGISQSNINSPFSRFGFGDINDMNLHHLRQMAGISAAYTNAYHINVQNPASLPFLRATSFDVGVSATYSGLKDAENSSGLWSGNLDYLSLAFPFRNPLNEAFERNRKDYWIGMNLSLIPYSTVSYDISTIESHPEYGDIDRIFTGSGGTNKVFWGTGFRYKNFSVGLNLGYLFGKIQQERNIDFLDIVTAYDDNFVKDYSVSGFTWNGGFMYQHILNKDLVDPSRGVLPNILQFGFFGNSNTSFSTETNSVFRNVFGTSIQAIYDTLSVELDVMGKGTLPSEFGLGISYYKGSNLLLGIQYMQTHWGNYKNDAQDEQLFDAYKLSFGGYYLPDYNSFKYSDRIYYRFGVFYGQDPRSFEGEQMKDYGLSVGLGLPFIYQRKISHINFGLNIGHRGRGGVLSETYVKLGLSLTFNDDEWFIQRRYN